jgi:hypothetical protein
MCHTADLQRIFVTFDAGEFVAAARGKRQQPVFFNLGKLWRQNGPRNLTR